MLGTFPGQSRHLHPAAMLGTFPGQSRHLHPATRARPDGAGL